MSTSPRTAIRVRVPSAVVRLGARQIGMRVLNPELPWEVQRRRLDRLMAGSPVPRGILVSPWLDLGRDRAAVPELVRRDMLLSPRWLKACATAYADPPSWSDPSVSPLLAEPAGLPPLLIQAGTDDLLAPDAEGLATRASAAGVDVTYTRWPRMWHNFALQAGLLPAAGSALAQAAWFVEQAAGS
jgi:acetyl esterase/lipase